MGSRHWLRGAALGALLLAAASGCGPSGHFNLQGRGYAADVMSAALVSNGDVEGVDVLLKADPNGSAIDDEVGVRVTLLWRQAARPRAGSALSIDDSALSALVRVQCFCGSTDAAFTEPVASGSVRFDSFEVDEESGRLLGLSGQLELTFKGQLALLSGGVYAEDETLTVSASGFAAD